ncbi:MAG: Holliday junction resolvase RecU [Peptostreptococcaceae bacterium]
MAETKKKTSHKNRGLKFEQLIEKKCEDLKQKKLALIHKVPTEFKMIRGAGGRVVSAFPVSESKFVDFVGIWNNGKSIAIEAKETKNKTSFPFDNIKQSQIEFLELWDELKGIGYYIIRFEELKRVFLIPSNVMNNCIKNIGRKSAPLSWFEETKEVIELDYKELDIENYI